MPYDPAIHNRRSIRLPGFDYTQQGMYFITICCDSMHSKFGHVQNGEMILNVYGKIAYYGWVKLAERFSNFQLDVFQFMPNHMHGIIILNGGGDGGVNLEKDGGGELIDDRVGASPARTGYLGEISSIVGAYKSLVANECLEIFKCKNEHMGKLWHRNYYEHIIRNEQSYQNISNYIINNPQKWEADKFNSGKF